MPRKKGSKNKTTKGWVKIGTQLSSQAARYVEERAAEGEHKNAVIDRALLRDRILRMIWRSEYQHSAAAARYIELSGLSEDKSIWAAFISKFGGI